MNRTLNSIYDALLNVRKRPQECRGPWIITDEELDEAIAEFNPENQYEKDTQCSKR